MIFGSAPQQEIAQIVLVGHLRLIECGVALLLLPIDGRAALEE